MHRVVTSTQYKQEKMPMQFTSKQAHAFPASVCKAIAM